MQVRLGDLMGLVIGSAFVFDVVRRSMAGWQGGLPDRSEVLSLIVLSLAVATGLILLGQGVRRWRDRGRTGWVGSALWRFLALGGLGWMIFEVVSTVVHPNDPWATMAATWAKSMRLDVIPLITMLAIVGLLLALAPVGPRRRDPRLQPGWSSRLSVVVGAVVAAVYVGLSNGNFPYLVLLALEAVRLALRRAPLVPRPVLFDRLDLACLEALPGLVGCLLTALWIDDDLRAAESDPLAARTPRSWLGLMGRIATVLLAVIGAWFVVARAIPELSPMVAEGIATIFDRSTLITIALGSAGLAAGISARSASRLVDPTDLAESQISNPWSRWVLGGIVGVGSLMIVAAMVLRFWKDDDEYWFLMMRLEAVWTFAAPLINQPGMLVIGILGLWSGYRLIRIVVGKGWEPASALDLVGGNRLVLGRFLGWWIGLTSLILASLPVLAVVSVDVAHHVIAWLTT